MTKCPCQHCTTETGRSQTCHCTCRDYLAYKAEREKVMQRRRDEHTLRNHCGSIKANAVKKTIGRKKLRHGLWGVKKGVTQEAESSPKVTHTTTPSF